MLVMYIIAFVDWFWLEAMGDTLV